MSKQQKFRVYLAGPISGCSNDDQVHRWRNDVKKSQYSRHFDFIDPADELELVGPGATARGAVEADLRAIKRADGLLVNMWRESIGSAIGIVHAHKEGRPVVVADPNHLRNRTLEFYADAVTDTPLKAANTLLDLLRAEATWEVVKRGSQREQFKRRKLVSSIRTACRRAKCDDIVVPRLALTAIIERLKNTRRIGRSLTTSNINDAVVATLDALETDHVHAETVRGVLEEWKSTVLNKKESFFKHRSSAAASSSVMKVEVASSKSHATIWGKAVKQLDDIPSKDARCVFRTISATPGITRIDLRQFNSRDSRSTCGAFVETSPTPFLIEGKLYDKGKKGTMQTFQICVQDNGEKDRIANDIKASLKKENRWFD